MTVVVIPMAGESSRFSKVGYTEPKWSLRLGNRTMIYWATQSIMPLVEKGADLIFGVRDGKQELLHASLYELNDIGKIVTLPFLTSGQAHTVSLMTQNILQDAPLIIWNCDAYLSPALHIHYQDLGNFILSSRLSGDHWSFVREDSFGNIVRTAEKKRISDLASVGLYGFNSIRIFNTLFVSEGHRNSRETFVAPLYNSLIKKESVRNLEIHPNLFVPFGTPSEYEQAQLLFEKSPKRFEN